MRTESVPVADPPAGLASAVFLDRDGTIIVDRGYVSDPSAVELLPGAAAAIGRLNEAGVPVIVITNQSGIGRGLYGEADFESVQAELVRRLGANGASIDAVYHCPHDPGAGACECRKPALGLYRLASRDLGVDLARAVYVGDRPGDVLPAVSTGGQGFLLVAESSASVERLPPAVAMVPDLAEVVRCVLGETGE